MDTWRILGPGGGGAQYYPSVSPHDPSLLFVACDMGGAYVSNDGGNSWRMFNLGSQVKGFSFDPSDANTVYALAAELWRSEDKGKTWKLIYPKPSDIVDIRYTDDEATRLVLTKFGVIGTATALAIDPADSSVLYGSFGSTLMMSKDRGRNWQQLGTFPVGSALKVYIDRQSPRGQRTVYAITRDRVCVYENGQYRALAPPVVNAWFVDASAAFSPHSARPTIYVIVEHTYKGRTPDVEGGLLRSTDGGASWRRADGNLVKSAVNIWSLPEYGAVQVADDNPARVYLSYTRLRQSFTDPNYFGVAKTEDAGATWRYLWKEAGVSAANVSDAWLSKALGPYWGENPTGIALVPTRPALIYTTDLGRTMQSTDDGATWRALYSKKLDDGSYTTTGLDVTAETGLFFDPFDHNRIFLAQNDIGLFRSENGGDGWISSNSGIEKSWLNTAYAVAFDPAVRGRMWAAVSAKHGIPSWLDVSKGATGFKGGIVISEDGGMNWRRSNSGMPEIAATDVLVDPASPPDHRVLYAAGYGTGFFKSTDGGRTWLLRNSGIPGVNPAAWRLVRDPNGILYGIIARRSVDGTYGTANDGALYRSIDQAETWVRLPLPEGVNGPMGLSIDPRDPNRLYIACWPRAKQYSSGEQGGVYASSDTGRTWKYVFSTNQYIWAVTVDPASPNVIYAAGWQSAIWKSTDRAESWYRLRGFNYKRATKVVPDPRDPTKIFVLTGGGGLWYGPSEGDSSAPEDVITPEIAFSNEGARNRPTRMIK